MDECQVIAHLPSTTHIVNSFPHGQALVVHFLRLGPVPQIIVSKPQIIVSIRLPGKVIYVLIDQHTFVAKLHRIR